MAVSPIVLLAVGGSDYEAGVYPTETKGVRKDGPGPERPSATRYIIEITGFIAGLEVQGRWNPAPLHCQARDGGFDGARGTERMGVIGFCPADRHAIDVIAEHLPDRA